MNKIFHVQIFKATNIFHFLKLIINIEINIIRDLIVCECAEMGIKPNTAYVVQVSELHDSEVVFASDNHNNNKKNLSIKFGNIFSSWF